jgi:hypothetical protein
MRATPIGSTTVIGDRLYVRSADGFRPYDGQTEGAVEFEDPAAVPNTPTAVAAQPTAVPRMTWDDRRSMLSKAGVPWSNDDTETIGAMLATNDDDFGGYVRRTATKYRGVVPQSMQTERDMAGRTAAVRGDMAQQNAYAAEQRFRAEQEQAANRRRPAPVVDAIRWSFA